MSRFCAGAWDGGGVARSVHAGQGSVPIGSLFLYGALDGTLGPKQKAVLLGPAGGWEGGH